MFLQNYTVLNWIIAFDINNLKLTIKKIVCILPQYLPLALAVEEYINLCDGILHEATLLLAANIHITTSGTLFWGCMAQVNNSAIQ